MENITNTDVYLLGLREYCISITEDWFLYKMVQFLVRILAVIGKDKATMDEFHNILQDTITTTTVKHHPKN